MFLSPLPCFNRIPLEITLYSFISPDSILIEKKKKKKLTFPRARERRITDLGAEVYFSLWAR